MEMQKIWVMFDALPTDAKYEVVDFMKSLQNRSKISKNNNSKRKKLSEEEFVGLWKDRNDLQDSTKWQRELRRGEWHN